MYVYSTITAITFQMLRLRDQDVRSIQWRTTNEVLFPLFLSLSILSVFLLIRRLRNEPEIRRDIQEAYNFFLAPLKSSVEKSFLERYYFQNFDVPAERCISGA